jgi:6-phosphogluconolactonase (cycloisomerase 2 family)
MPGVAIRGRYPGLNSISSLAVSPDGKYLYAASLYTLAWFKRDPVTGAVVFKGCLTSIQKSAAAEDPGSCVPIPSTTSAGIASGLFSFQSMVVSPGGKALYAADQAGSLTTFRRDPTTGGLTYKACITGDTHNVGCTQIPSAVPFGEGSGLGDLRSVVVSPDGKWVYAADATSDVARFSVTPKTRTPGGPGGVRNTA